MVRMAFLTESPWNIIFTVHSVKLIKPVGAPWLEGPKYEVLFQKFKRTVSDSKYSIVLFMREMDESAEER